jgi:hypothetical protein
LKIQFQDLDKGKEKHEEVWCVTCKKEGHHKKECLAFAYYLDIGGLNPLAMGGGVWCEICRTMGHHPTACPLMRSIRALQEDYFVIFVSLWDMMKKLSCTQYNERTHLRYIQSSRGRSIGRRGIAI